MLAKRTYRRIVPVLALLFFLFNVGIPVIVAACPMSDADNSSACSSCATTAVDNADSILPRTDTSCCATVFTPGPTNTAYLKAPAAEPSCELNLGMVLTIPAVDCSSPVGSFSGADPDQPVFFSSDLPVLLSSLLI